jgi:hypothetical protein
VPPGPLGAGAASWLLSLDSARGCGPRGEFGDSDEDVVPVPRVPEAPVNHESSHGPPGPGMSPVAELLSNVALGLQAVRRCISQSLVHRGPFGAPSSRSAAGVFVVPFVFCSFSPHWSRILWGGGAHRGATKHRKS